MGRKRTSQACWQHGSIATPTPPTGLALAGNGAGFAYQLIARVEFESNDKISFRFARLRRHPRERFTTRDSIVRSK